MNSEPPIEDPYLPRDRHEFALALDWRLRQLGMSQAELARRLVTRSGTVNAWVKGHRVPTSRKFVTGLLEITGIATPADPELARRARVDLEERVEALEHVVSELVAALRASDAAQRRLLIDAVAEAMGLTERPGQAKGPPRPRRAKGSDG